MTRVTITFMIWLALSALILLVCFLLSLLVMTAWAVLLEFALGLLEDSSLRYTERFYAAGMLSAGSMIFAYRAWSSYMGEIREYLGSLRKKCQPDQ